MEPTLLRWLFIEPQPTPLDVAGVRQAHWSIPLDRTRDPGKYPVVTRKLVDGLRGVPGFLTRGECLPVAWFEARLYVRSPGSNRDLVMDVRGPSGGHPEDTLRG